VAGHVLSDASELSDDERHLVGDLVEALIDLVEALIDVATELFELRPCDAALDRFERDPPLAEGAFVEDHRIVLAAAHGDRGGLLARDPRSAARAHEVTASNARTAVQGTAVRVAQESLGKGLVRMGIGSARTVPWAESANPLDFPPAVPVQGRFEGGPGQVRSSPIPSRHGTKPCGAVVEARGHYRSKSTRNGSVRPLVGCPSRCQAQHVSPERGPAADIAARGSLDGRRVSALTGRSLSGASDARRDARPGTRRVERGPARDPTRSTRDPSAFVSRARHHRSK
jgi:hypothetical protein